jgi:phosphate-selective porin
MMSPSRGIPFAERAAPVTVFVPTRNDGVRFWGSIPRTHGGWSAGIFNDSLLDGHSLRANGYQANGRVFYAPIVSADSNRALQFALDARWSGASGGLLSYKTRPENNEAPDFVDTKSFSASSGLTGDAELLIVHDDVSFTAEVLPTQVAGTSGGTPTFLAFYGALSWRPGGAARPYNEQTGTLGRVRMGDRRFVPEIGLRFSHTDLSSEAEEGGVLDLPSLSVGVFGPSSTRILLDYGFSILKRNGVTGRASLITLRVQWELL